MQSSFLSVRFASRGVCLLALALSLTFSVGCGGALHQSGSDVASGAVEGSLEEMAEPSTQAMLVETMNDPELVQAMSNLTEAAVGGVVDGMSETERALQLQEASDAVVAHLGRAFARSLDEDIRPVLARTIAQSVEQSLAAALGPQAQERVEALAFAAARGAMQGINEGMNGMQMGDLSGSVAEMARMAGREATLGVQDAVRISSAREAQGVDGEGQVLAAVGETADALLGTSPWLLVLLGLLVVAAVVAVVWLVVRARRRQAEQRRETEQAVSALNSALHAAERGVPVEQIRSEVERAARNQPNGAALRQAVRSWEQPQSRPGA